MAKKKAQELADSIHWIEGNLSFLSSNLSHDRGWNAASDLTKAIQKATALKKEIRDGLSVTGLNLQWGTPEDLIGQLNTLIAETEKRQLQTSQSLKRLGEKLAHGMISHKLKRVREELNALKDDAAQELLNAKPSSSPLPGPVHVEDWLEWFWDRDDDADQILENLEGDYPSLAVFLQAVSPEQWQSLDSSAGASSRSTPHEGRSGKAPDLPDETGRTWASGSGDPDLDSAWSQLCATDWVGLSGPKQKGQSPQKEVLPPAKNSTSTSDIHWDTVSWIPTGPVDPFSAAPPVKPEISPPTATDLPVEQGVKSPVETRPEAFPTVPLFGEGATHIPTMGPVSPVAPPALISPGPVTPPAETKSVKVAPPWDVIGKEPASQGNEKQPGTNTGWTSFQEALLRGGELPPDPGFKGEAEPVGTGPAGKEPGIKGPNVWGQPRSDRKEAIPKSPKGNGPSGLEEVVPPSVAVGTRDPWGLPSAKKTVGQPDLPPVVGPQGFQSGTQPQPVPGKTGPAFLPEQVPSGQQAAWVSPLPAKPVADPFAPVSGVSVPAQQKLDPWSIPVSPQPQEDSPAKRESLEQGVPHAGAPAAPKAEDPWKAAARSKDTPFGGVKAWSEGPTGRETPSQPKGADPWAVPSLPKETPLAEGKPGPEALSKKDIPSPLKANDPWSAPARPPGQPVEPVKPPLTSGPVKDPVSPPKAIDPWAASTRPRENPEEPVRPPGEAFPAKDVASSPKANDPWSVPVRTKDSPLEPGKAPGGNAPENPTGSPRGADPWAVPGHPKESPVGQAKGPNQNAPVPPKGIDPWASVPSRPMESAGAPAKGPVPASDPWARPVSQGMGGSGGNSPDSGDPKASPRKPSWGRPKKPVAIDPNLAEPVKGEQEPAEKASVPQPPVPQWGKGKTPVPVAANPSPSPAPSGGASAGHPGPAHPGSPVHWGSSQPVQNQPLINDALKSIGAPSASETEAMLRGTAPVTSDLEAMLRGTAPKQAGPSPAESRPNPAPEPEISPPPKSGGGGAGIVWEKPPQEKAFQGGWGKGPMDSLAHPSTAPKMGPATQVKKDSSQVYGGVPSGQENRPYTNGAGSPFNGNGNGKSLFAEPPRPATRMRETASRSSSQGGSIFEAASSRRMIRNDPWLRSPLNTDQEAILTDLSNGVVVVFGSRLSGLDKLMDGIREIPNLTGVIAAGPMTESHQFEAWLTEVNNSLANMPNGTALAVVDSSIRWSVQWIRFASNLLRSRIDHGKFLRVVFVADPSHDWTWTGDEERRQLGAFELTLRQ